MVRRPTDVRWRLGYEAHHGEALAGHDLGLSPVVELRQYTLRPGQRDVLVELFDSKFVEPQEQVGIMVIGQFRDLDRSDRFVWLRGFRNMAERARSLGAFYDGPVWRAHRDAANATMIDSDDVLLLRPARAGSAFSPEGNRPPRSFAAPRRRGFVAAMIMPLEAAADETDILSFFEQAIAPTLGQDGGSILGYFVTETSENTFPRLPVRGAEQVFVWFAGCADEETLARVTSESSDAVRTAAQAPALASRPSVLRLAPTTRSLLHGLSPRCRTALMNLAT